MFQSNGVLTKEPDRILWQGSPRRWLDNKPLGYESSSYSQIYRSQLWVHTLVNKRANAVARLPLKVYRRAETGRLSARDTPFGQLLAAPSTLLDPFLFWLWTASTLDIHGEAIWGKVRDDGGRPIELVPFHPCYVKDETKNGKTRWWYESADLKFSFDRRDIVHFRTFNPSTMLRGMSPLEPLRATLDNEDGARRANSALWRNGGRPSIVLEHPGIMSEDAALHLSAQWSDIHGGVDNWAKALVLEEAMTANVLSLNVEELQYIEGRKLNREEVCAVYDMPPAAVHILDHATFSNITENLRSVYRDTMAPRLTLFESTIEFELRDGRFSERSREPDFGSDVYSEFLLDEVLRGDFEARSAAYLAANYMTLAEKREKENLPFIEGTDFIFLNSATLPLGPNGLLVQPEAAVDPVEPSDDDDTPMAPVIPIRALRSVLGRLGRCKTMAELNIPALDVPAELKLALTTWRDDRLTLEAVRAHLAALMRNEDQ